MCWVASADFSLTHDSEKDGMEYKELPTRSRKKNLFPKTLRCIIEATWLDTNFADRLQNDKAKPREHGKMTKSREQVIYLYWVKIFFLVS